MLVILAATTVTIAVIATVTTIIIISPIRAGGNCDAKAWHVTSIRVT
jgi:hypothetical protein